MYNASTNEWAQQVLMKQNMCLFWSKMMNCKENKIKCEKSQE